MIGNLLSNCSRSHGVCIAVCALILGTAEVEAFSRSDADLAMESYTRSFYAAGEGKGHFKNTTEGGMASFWMQAEELEMVLDAYERTTNASHLAMFTNLFNGFVARHGADWQHNPFDPDHATNKSVDEHKEPELSGVLAEAELDLGHGSVFSRQHSGWHQPQVPSHRRPMRSRAH